MDPFLYKNIISKLLMMFMRLNEYDICADR